VRERALLKKVDKLGVTLLEERKFDFAIAIRGELDSEITVCLMRLQESDRSSLIVGCVYLNRLGMCGWCDNLVGASSVLLPVEVKPHAFGWIQGSSASLQEIIP